MWIKVKDKNTMLNLDLCENIYVFPYSYGQYSVTAYQNGDEHCIGVYNTEDEANKAFETILHIIARNDYLITME
jgi:hypothetical protein